MHVVVLAEYSKDHSTEKWIAPRRRRGRSSAEELSGPGPIRFFRDPTDSAGKWRQLRAEHYHHAVPSRTRLKSAGCENSRLRRTSYPAAEADSARPKKLVRSMGNQVRSGSWFPQTGRSPRTGIRQLAPLVIFPECAIHARRETRAGHGAGGGGGRRDRLNRV